MAIPIINHHKSPQKSASSSVSKWWFQHAPTDLPISHGSHLRGNVLRGQSHCDFLSKVGHWHLAGVDLQAVGNQRSDYLAKHGEAVTTWERWYVVITWISWDMTPTWWWLNLSNIISISNLFPLIGWMMFEFEWIIPEHVGLYIYTRIYDLCWTNGFLLVEFCLVWMANH